MTSFMPYNLDFIGQQPAYSPQARFAPPLNPLYGGATPGYGGGGYGGYGGGGNMTPPSNMSTGGGVPSNSYSGWDPRGWNWGQIAQIGGGLAQGYGAAQGASEGNAAAAANYAAQQAHAQRILSLIQPLMQQGQNPYASQYQQMLSGLTSGTSGQITPPGGPYAPPSAPPGGWPGMPWPPEQLPYSQLSGSGQPSNSGGGGFAPPNTPSFTSLMPDLGNLGTGLRPGPNGPNGPMSQGSSGGSMVGPNGLVDPRGSRLQQPFTYNPALAQQQAPMNAFTQQLMQGFTPERMAAPGAVSTQQFNGGQDGLMQMMRREITPGRDSGLDANLNRQASGMERFDNSDLFKALEPLDNRRINQQVDQLRAGAGSLGQRFGTAMARNEADLRGVALEQIGARNAGLQRESYETAQGRSMQALGLQLPYQQSREQQPFQNAAMQLEAARAAGGFGVQGAQLDLQAQLANVENQMKVATNNQSAGLTAGLEGQRLQQTQLAQNQSAQNQTKMTDAQLIQSIILANQQAQNRAGEYNANAGMQGAAYNQGLDSQANQMIMALLSGAQGADAQQLNQNMGLIGLLAGVGVPQQAAQQNPWGDIGQIGMILPYLMQNRG